jgi:hypothetical protein
MARVQSPGYPNSSLPKAIQSVRMIFDADRRNPIDREVAAKHIGYGGSSGASDKALATLAHYGLTEKVAKGEIRVSQLALDIIHPDKPEDRKRALVLSAFNPQIFKDLRERFGGGHVSEGALESYLKRENFLDRAITPVTKAYLETCRYLEQEKAFESGGIEGSEAEESDSVEFEEAPMDTADTLKKTPPPPPPPTPQTFDAPAGMRKFVINLPNGGDAILAYPGDLTAEGYQDLEDYLNLFFKKAKRQTPQAPEAPDKLPNVL